MRTATLTFFVSLDDDDMGDDELRELLLDVLHSLPDKELMEWIEVKE